MVQGRSEKGWSFDRVEWELIPKWLFENGRWGKVPFEAASTVPSSPGVYVICASQPDGRHMKQHSSGNLFGMLYSAIYVGMASNLQDRFKTHTGPNAQVNIMRTRLCFKYLDYWYLETADSQEAEDLESKLQRVLGPPAIKRFEGIEVVVSGRTNATTKYIRR